MPHPSCCLDARFLRAATVRERFHRDAVGLWAQPDSTYTHAHVKGNDTTGCNYQGLPLYFSYSRRCLLSVGTCFP